MTGMGLAVRAVGRGCAAGAQLYRAAIFAAALVSARPYPSLLGDQPDDVIVARLDRLVLEDSR
jgi:hypothetical protein